MSDAVDPVDALGGRPVAYRGKRAWRRADLDADDVAALIGFHALNGRGDYRWHSPLPRDTPFPLGCKRKVKFGQETPDPEKYAE